MALSHDQILDLVKTTQKELGKMKWTEIATDLQEYEVLSKMLKRDKVSFATGEGLQRNLMVDESGAAKHVGLFNADDVNVGDVMQVMDVPFRHSTTNYAFDRRERAMNEGPEQIVELIKVRRADAMISLAKLLEDCFWDDHTGDNVTPFGIRYWVQGSTSQGFNGGNHAQFASGPGNLSATDFPRWSNYTDKFSNITKGDAIKKMRRAPRLTDFKSPVDIPDYRTSKGQNYRIYMNEETISAFEDVGEAQNENLGRDLASMDGNISFRRNPLVYIPKLDAETNKPIYLINWGVFSVFFLKGEHLREDGPLRVAGQHNVYQVHVDLSWNSLCVDRRRLATLSPDGAA